MHARDWRQHHAGKSGESYGEPGEARNIGRKRDAERADDIGVLHARPYHTAECSPIYNEPGCGCGCDRYAENDEAIARVNKIANEYLAAQFRWNRKRKR